MLQGDLACLFGNVPDLDGVVERGGCHHVLGGWVELQMADLTCVADEGPDGLDVDDVVWVDVHVGVVLRNVPDEDLAVFSGGEHPLLVKRVERCV